MEDLVVLPDDRVALILTAPIEIDKGGMSILEVKKKRGLNWRTASRSISGIP